MSNRSSSTGRVLAAAAAILGLIGLFVSLVASSMPKGEVRRIDGYQPWSKETLKVAEALPVQDGGRIKPLATHAGFTMLATHGSRGMKVAGGDGKTVRLTPTAWILDTLFRPQFAMHHPTFRVDNAAVLEAIGVKTAHKRDRYSYHDIASGLEKLWELARAYEAIPKEARQPIQQQVLDFAFTVGDYERLLGQFTFARNGIRINDAEGSEPLAISTILEMSPKIREDLEKARAAGQQSNGPAQYLYDETYQVSRLAMQGFNLLPPPDRADPAWESAGVAIMSVLNGESPQPAQGIQDIQRLEALSRAASDEPAFRQQLTALRDDLVARAASRGEARYVAMEASYYRIDWFLNAFVLFFIGGLCAMAMWLAGNGRAGKILAWATLACCVAGVALCVTAITQRCLIMQRAPVGNLYDTIVFIGTAVVVFALVLEWFFRRRFALGVAPILGAVLIYLSRRFEMGDPKDHMDPLVAVLASNFWLTIHVITITLGYASGLLASFLSTLYVLMRGLRLDDGRSEPRLLLTRATYGIICVTLFLSLVGTVLGGIWANDSWGRFWGWDPKENGALLIVVWTLVILHARAGGLIREWGLHLASVFMACVIVFSWWHVNFLGVGLHNYGFTTGKEAIWSFYAAMAVVIVFGWVARSLERRRRDLQLERRQHAHGKA